MDLLEPNRDTKGGNDMEDTTMFVPDIPKDIIFPEELNAYLRDQIQCLTHENGMLKRNLSETESKLESTSMEVQTLAKQLRQFEEATPGNSFSTVSNIASAKIVELSKKLREKCAELEASKSKCAKMEGYIRNLEETSKNEIKPPVSEDDKPKPKGDQIDELKQLQDKLSAANVKLFDAKNSNTQLKNDLKLANKLLQSEVGESFENLQSLINSGVSWRGRAQMVCDLQQKNTELKDKLKTLLDKNPKQPEPQPPPPKQDRRLDNLSKENAALKAEVRDLKRKLDAGKARLKVFETDNSILKGKLSAVHEQQDNDRNLVASLTGQLSTIRNVQNDETKRKDQTIAKLQKELREAKGEAAKEKCRADNAAKSLQEKQIEIDKLKGGGVMKRPISGIKPTTDERIVSRLEAEKVRLLELTKIANERLEGERKVLGNLQMQLKGERQKNAKLESKIARLELDKNDASSVYANTSSARAKGKEGSIRDKLELAEENIKTLRTRLEIEQKERQMDFQEFSKILQNYKPING